MYITQHVHILLLGIPYAPYSTIDDKIHFPPFDRQVSAQKIQSSFSIFICQHQNCSNNSYFCCIIYINYTIIRSKTSSKESFSCQHLATTTYFRQHISIHTCIIPHKNWNMSFISKNELKIFCFTHCIYPTHIYIYRLTDFT